MKTIFVTIEEFVANGGKLEPGMMIYREEKRHFPAGELPKNELLENSLQLGTFLEHDTKTGAYILTNSTYKKFPITCTIGYVKITATPIYKTQ